MNAIVHEHCWGLRTNPFYPDVDPQGQALPRTAFESTLDPAIDPRVILLFFDVYDWTNSKLVSGLSTGHALQIFPTARTLPADAPLMVIISGARRTGLDSLANLIAYKTQLASDRQLLTANVELNGRARARNVIAVANKLIDMVRYRLHAEHQADAMSRRLEQAVREQAGRSDATYADVFDVFAIILEPLDRDVVVRINSGGDNDSSAGIYDSVRRLAKCVIVTTPDYAYAKTCYEALVTLSQNVAWVRAMPLDAQRTRDFVRSRLDGVRLTQPGAGRDRLYPFSRQAIDSRFGSGAGRRSGDAPGGPGSPNLVQGDDQHDR